MPFYSEQFIEALEADEYEQLYTAFLYSLKDEHEAKLETQHQLAWIGSMLAKTGSYVVSRMSGKAENIGAEYAPAHWGLQKPVDNKPKTMKDLIAEDERIAQQIGNMTFGRTQKAS